MGRCFSKQFSCVGALAMKVDIRHSLAPLVHEQIVALEERLGIWFTDEYRTFLLRHNGGIPRPNGIQGPVTGKLDWFLPIGRDGIFDPEWQDLESAFAHLSRPCSTMPAGLVPIASIHTESISGVIPGFLCLALKGKDRGKIFAWCDGEKYQWPSPLLVAEDLSSLLAKLHYRNGEPPNWQVLIENGDTAGFQEWLETEGKPALKARTGWNQTPTDIAIRENRWEILLKLIHLGESPNHAFDRAMDADRFDLARRLLSHGVKPAVIRNALPNTFAGGYQYVWKDLELVRALVDAGANVNRSDSDGATPLHSAANEGEAAAVRLLLERGAKPGKFTHEGETALYLAAQAGSLEAMKVLIDAGEDLHASRKPKELPQLQMPASTISSDAMQRAAQMRATMMGIPLEQTIADMQAAVLGLARISASVRQEFEMKGISPAELLKRMGRDDLLREILDYAQKPRKQTSVRAIGFDKALENEPDQEKVRSETPASSKKPAGRSKKHGGENELRTPWPEGITIAKSKRKLEESDLLAFERKVGTTLPIDYRDFLLTHNGGEPSKNHLPYQDHRDRVREFVIWRFLSLGGKAENDLRKQDCTNKDSEVRLPKHLLPIAGGDRNDYVCLAVTGKDRGKIFVACIDWENPQWDGEGILSEEGIYPVAESFHQLLACLHCASDFEDEEEDEE